MRPDPPRRPRRHRLEGGGGYTLALIALLIVPMIGFVALATDVGAWYAEATSAQRAADAAALAGVVWMPDLDRAAAVARDVAQGNGYDDDDADVEVLVAVVPGNSTQLQVEVRQHDPPIFFAGVVLDRFTVARQAIAEYVLPVPMGSPRNHLGTGDLLDPEEGFTLAINGFCAPFEHGDLKAPRFAGNHGGGSDIICPSNAQVPAGPGPDAYSDGSSEWEYNPYYDGTRTYEYYITHPDNNEDTTILLHDPGMHDSNSTDVSFNWNGDVTTTFSIRAPDGTPLSDADNPPFTGCSNLGGASSVTYANNDTSVHTTTAAGSSRWAVFCRIPAAAAAGRYIVAVENLAGEQNSVAANNYSILARRASLGDTCDSRTAAGCPQVYSTEWMSIRAGTRATAEFYLAEVGDEHEDKTLRLVLYDPGENGNTISILDPEGQPAEMTWSTFDGLDGGTGTTIDVSGTVTPRARRDSDSKFNERFLEILVRLPADFDVAYPTGDRWWRVSYDYNGEPRDRTTWSASIIGDPVRLVA